MKKLLIISAVVLAACNSKKDDAKTDSMKSGTDTTMQAINSPYPVGYSSQFAIDQPKNAETLLTLWKDWDNGDLSAHKDMFADTMEIHFADGSFIRSAKDSVIAGAQGYRNTFTSSVSSVDAVMAVKSTDKNQGWALIWGKEIDKDKKGKVDSFYLQETWRFNDAGKADLMYQFKAGGAPPKK